MPKTVDEVVTDLVNVDTPFTAYVVFQELRKSGVQDTYHNMKQSIHDAVKAYVTKGVYQRTMVNSPTGDTWLYHPPGYDPDTFFQKNVNF